MIAPANYNFTDAIFFVTFRCKKSLSQSYISKYLFNNYC